MESLGYTLLYLYLGKLKWQYEQSKENIRTMKTEVLCDDKIPHVLLDYFIYISKLGFKDEPDYEKIINDFRTEIDILV
jgi:hypothetical protein